MVIAALTRASADFQASIQISHCQYTAWSWMIAALTWALWHARRFFKKDASPE